MRIVLASLVLAVATPGMARATAILSTDEVKISCTEECTAPKPGFRCEIVVMPPASFFVLKLKVSGGADSAGAPTGYLTNWLRLNDGKWGGLLDFVDGANNLMFVTPYFWAGLPDGREPDAEGGLPFAARVPECQSMATQRPATSTADLCQDDDEKIPEMLRVAGVRMTCTFPSTLFCSTPGYGELQTSCPIACGLCGALPTSSIVDATTATSPQSISVGGGPDGPEKDCSETGCPLTQVCSEVVLSVADRTFAYRCTCSDEGPPSDSSCKGDQSCRIFNGDEYDRDADDHTGCTSFLECQCEAGFRLDPAAVSGCADVNECDYAPCARHAVCHNTVGSFECKCLDGWQGDGSACIADCALDQAMCRNGAVCHIEDGCTCPPGFAEVLPDTATLSGSGVGDDYSNAHQHENSLEMERVAVCERVHVDECTERPHCDAVSRPDDVCSCDFNAQCTVRSCPFPTYSSAPASHERTILALHTRL